MKSTIVFVVFIPFTFFIPAFHGKLIHPGAGIVVDKKGQVFFADLSRGLIKIDTPVPIVLWKLRRSIEKERSLNFLSAIVIIL